MNKAGLDSWAEIVVQQIDKGLDANQHGDLERWQSVIQSLPEIKADQVSFTDSAITVKGETLGESTQIELEKCLKGLMPWRKGPYLIHNVFIDTEWRSDWKWQRLKDKIQPLENKVVLDVGCGNGYHGWRMLGENAKLVIGVDPSALFVVQQQCIKHFVGDLPFYVLPLGIESVPENLQAFDSVFSMGVLYHRRSPIDHMMQLRQCLKPAGELILETLVIDGNENQVLIPKNRYAKMRNVWFIPSCDAIILWLSRCGYKNIKLIDVCDTTIEEQRSTEWMQYDSLETYLDPDDASLTIEGYAAPKRAVFTAEAP